MLHSLIAGKSVLSVSRLLNRSGSTWPGHITLKFDSKFIRRALSKNPGVKVVLVAGTNGKTTTTKAIAHILDSSGYETLTNQAGANLLNGLASLIVNHITLEGKLKHKALIFEVDENSLPLVLNEIPNPYSIVLLNLFRDQLDRYGEVNTTAEKWIESLKKLNDSTLVIANADDPLIAYVASYAARKKYFSIEDTLKTSKELDHAVDSITCPKCNNDLKYSKISYSHLGNYECTNCGFKKPETKSFDFKSNLKGIYNAYNLSAAANTALLFGIKIKDIENALTEFKPAFGRQETIEMNGKRVMFLLSKNPTGFNESLKVANEERNSSLLILLNDRIPDGRDISWIWDVDFEILENKRKVFVSGDRAYDLANRLLFANVSHEVYEDPKKAYDESLAATQKGELLTILPTYSAMLEIRKYVSGKSIL